MTNFSIPVVFALFTVGAYFMGLYVGSKEPSDSPNCIFVASIGFLFASLVVAIFSAR